MTEKIDSTAGYFLAGVAIGSLISIFFAPKSGEGTREYLSKKVKAGGKHVRRRARELRENAGDLIDSGKQFVNETKDQIAGKLEEAGEDYLPKKSKAKSF